MNVYENLEKATIEIKNRAKEAIKTEGYKGFISTKRASDLILPIHEAIKKDFIRFNIMEEQILPKLGERTGEMKIFGSQCSKRMDISILPKYINFKEEILDITDNKNKRKIDKYGKHVTENSLFVDIKSQFCSIGKNQGTLRTNFIGLNADIKERCPKTIIGNLTVLPIYEFDTEAMKEHKMRFSNNPINVEEYLIRFNKIQDTSSLNNSSITKFNKVALVLVDFSQKIPHIFTSHQELVKYGLVSSDFNMKYSYDNIKYTNFHESLINIYHNEHDIENIMKQESHKKPNRVPKKYKSKK